MDRATLWFYLVGVLFAGYAVLDGFDFGVGTLHLLHRGDEHRRLSLNSIGPVWDGNEVWLVTGGGALFAAFPEVYATVFSGFYLAFVLLLVALIFRAVAIEFRSKQPSGRWRQTWDVAFSVASAVAPLLMGVALGNVAMGIPLDADYEYAGTFLGLLNPYSLLVGCTTVALFAMHGAIYLVLKTEGEMRASAERLVRPTIVAFAILYVLVTMATLLYVPHMAERIKAHPLLFLLPTATMLAVANIPREIFHQRPGRAFLSSSVAIVLLMTLFGVGTFPNLVIASNDSALSLTVHNAASSAKSLGLMLVIATIGLPVVLSYTIAIYWMFRGKVQLGPTSY
jgi:cytochrome d ubiquinol oxidase subunit II